MSHSAATGRRTGVRTPPRLVSEPKDSMFATADKDKFRDDERTGEPDCGEPSEFSNAPEYELIFPCASNPERDCHELNDPIKAWL